MRTAAVRCASCHRNVAAGVEAQKMIVEYRQADGSSKLFGYMMADGPISAATGALVRGWHHKCHWVAKKREARGDAVTGRVVPGTPTGYDIDQLVLNRDDLAALGITEAQARERGTVRLSARVAHLRELAERMGKGIGDAQVTEAFHAAEAGGPYRHEHFHKLDTYQLIAHLEFAHGRSDVRQLDDVHAEHMRLHVYEVNQGIVERRAADGEQTTERDWRQQHVVELEQGSS